MLRMTVLYPHRDDTTFDWDYYTNKHMSLVEEKFGPHMAREPEVTKGLNTVPKGDPIYTCTAVMYFDDRDALDAALKAGGQDIPGDIPNFYDGQAVIQLDELV